MTPEFMKSKLRELARLERLIKPGMSRVALFDTLAEFKPESGLELGIRNYVVGYQKYKERIRKTRKPLDNDPDYQTLLLSVKSWKFIGLKEEVWYDSFYSNVTIYFRDNRIERITHMHFPIELP